MAKLTSKRRNAPATSQFALPGRKYPLDTANRATNALARGSEYASPAQQATIRRKVKSRYPGISVSA